MTAPEVNDFEYQFSHVLNQVPRLLSLQDNNPASPSHGCFHYAYWRDKTSEFSDARFQEAGAALGLLTHPTLIDRVPEAYQSRLAPAFLAGLKNWGVQQHADGSFDEWYKHEHGFAATEFTLIAYGLAMYHLGEQAGEEAWELFRPTALKAARWLEYRDDMVKMNHEMAGAAALAIASKVLREPDFMKAASQKHQTVLNRQRQEGWFNEINGMDLGYCSVLLDYAMLYRLFSEDSSGTAAMIKLYAFLEPSIQKDLTILPESGLCLNPYVSRLGTLLLSPDSEEAKNVTSRFARFSPEQEGVGPYLMDDLRLCRWSYLPICTILELGEEMDPVGQLHAIAEERTESFKESNLVAVQRKDWSMSFAPCGGGGVKIVHMKEGYPWSITDLGYRIAMNGECFSSAGYDPSRPVEKAGELSWKLKVSFAPTSFMFPGFISRLGLRVLGAIPGFPKYLRMGIDLYRKINKTALNQSAAPVASNNAVYTLERQVRVEGQNVVIEDQLISREGYSIKSNDLQLSGHLGSKHGEYQEQLKSLGTAKTLHITKTFQLEGEPSVDTTFALGS